MQDGEFAWDEYRQGIILGSFFWVKKKLVLFFFFQFSYYSIF